MSGPVSVRALVWVAVCLLSIAVPDPVPAATSAASVCDDAARRAARVSGVPLRVLQAVTRTETGRPRDGQLAPWPWTVNMEGAGRWFATKQEARAWVQRHYQQGARSFDVGCFQINYKWHASGFRSIDAMFDPVDNAGYAAEFLNELHDRLGSWEAAVGAFHSRTPELAERYLARYRRIYAALPENEGPAPLMAGRRPLVAAGTPLLAVHHADPAGAAGAVLGSLFATGALR